MNQVKQLFTRYKMLALVFAVALIWLFFSWQTEGGFLTPRNLSNLLRQMSITGILACGMVLVIISGEIDLSVGSLLGLLGGVAAILDVVYHIPLLANLSLVVVCGLLIGLANGYMAAYLRIPSFIVGLGGCWRSGGFCWESPAARPLRRCRRSSFTLARVICHIRPARDWVSCCSR